MRRGSEIFSQRTHLSFGQALAAGFGRKIPPSFTASPFSTAWGFTHTEADCI